MRRLLAWIRRTLLTPAPAPVDPFSEDPDFGELEACRGCGCTEALACPGGCWWVGRGLCSRCVAGYGGTD